jgi:hypothetical protein
MKRSVRQFILKVIAFALLAGALYSFGFYTGYSQGQENYQKKFRDSHQFLFEKPEPVDSVRKS